MALPLAAVVTAMCIWTVIGYYRVAASGLLHRRGWVALKPAVFDTNHLEEIMFANEQDSKTFTENCGRSWRDLFSSWERMQRRALLGDRAVKAVVWRCNIGCGGLGDRQRGILTSFMLALVLDRAFFVDNEAPVPLRHFFQVAHPALHWVFDEGIMQGRSVLTEYFMNELPPLGDYATANLSYYDQYDFIVQSNNFWQPFHVLRNPYVSDRTLVFRRYDEHVLAGCLLNYLLVPVRDIQTQLQGIHSNVAARAERLLAVQVRTGDSQSKNATVLNNFIRMFRDCVDKLNSTIGPPPTIFLTTDSSQALAIFQTHYPNLLTFSGEIFHVDGPFGNPDSPAAAFRKLVLDQMLLAQADELIISRSGFAEFAALRGFKHYYTPVNCEVGNPIPHYALPTSLPPGLSGNDINSMDSMLAALTAGAVP